MAQHITVTLEHHLNRRYHTVNCGPGRRPAAVTYGRFNLRFRDPLQNGKRVRVPLDASDLSEAITARRRKEDELNAAPAVERKPRRTLQRVADEYLKEIKATRKKRTWQAYSVALCYFIAATGDKSLDEITRHDMLNYSVFLRDVKKQKPRSVWNKFSNVMGFLKLYGAQPRDPKVTKHDWPQYVEEEPEIYEHEELDTFFAACDEDERVIFEFFLKTGMREQEVVYATDRCVDFANCEVKVRHNPTYGWTPKMYKRVSREMVSPELTVSLGFSVMSSQPHCTSSGVAASAWCWPAVFACCWWDFGCWAKLAPKPSMSVARTATNRLIVFSYKPKSRLLRLQPDG